ncbi:WecB/TagA/CpsF family glycosyltransferase [Gordonia hongkongensis]|uniref:WecB/TagA/CpsF family glycosyltransferase n=1 Tax=Gordonia hongkongensis TaxID=1701090 RepID=UPI003D757C3B
MKNTDICGFRIEAGQYAAAVESHLEWLTQRRSVVSYALHIGGLNLRSDEQYVQVFNSCDYAYPDGMSVVLLARLAGQTKAERVSTTDLGHDLLLRAPQLLGRPTRVAAIGGSVELSRSVSSAIERKYDAVVCYSRNGYDDFREEDSQQLIDSKPDLVLVGMGMPNEAFFCATNRPNLPDCLIMTCGGWFGFICEIEARAPVFAQKSGLEWVYRLSQNPRRLAKRYGSGVITMIALGAELALGRLRKVLLR